MSLYYYFASNQKLEEQRNPHLSFLSVQEAMDQELDIDLDLLEGVDKDEPDVIMYVENEEDFFYPNIYEENPRILQDECNVERNSAVGLEWDYKEEQVEIVLSYLKKQLETNEFVEWYKIWMGEYRQCPSLQYEEIYVDALNNDVIRQFMEDENDFKCLCIKR